MAALAWVAQPADAQTPPDSCVDVSFVLDKSGSMNGPPSVVVREGAKYLVDQLNATTDQSGVRNFYPSTADDKTLSYAHGATKTGIDQLTGGGGLTMYTAIQQSNMDFLTDGRAAARWVMVIMSDGFNEISTPPAATARGDGIEIYSIGVATPSVDTAHMQSLASSPVSKYYKEVSTVLDAYAAMDEIIADVVGCPPIELDLDITVGCYPGKTTLNVVSPDLASGRIISLEWDLGDGSTVGPTPVISTVAHAYPATGTYTVRVDAADALGIVGNVSKTFTLPKCPPTAPIADFGCPDLDLAAARIGLVDLSVDKDGYITDWEWTVESAGTYTGQDPGAVDLPGAGTYAVTLTVTDNENMMGTITKPCKTVVLRPPIIAALPEPTVYEGETIAFTVEASDADGDPLNYWWTQAAVPAGAHLDGADFTWTTTKGQAGDYGPVVFYVSDGTFVVAGTTYMHVLPVQPKHPEPNSDADGDGSPDEHDPCPSGCDEVTAEPDTSAPDGPDGAYKPDGGCTATACPREGEGTDRDGPGESSWTFAERTSEEAPLVLQGTPQRYPAAAALTGSGGLVLLLILGIVGYLVQRRAKG